MDEDNYLEAKRAGYDLINEARASLGLHPLQYDAQLSLLASEHCKEMATQGYLSHFDLKGRPPFRRYFEGGVPHHVEEALWEKDAPEGKEWDPEDAAAQRALVEEGVRAFFAQEEPADYEKRVVLGERHTHVALGAWLAAGGRRFRLAAVAADAYLQLEPVAPELHAHEVMLEGRCAPGWGPYGALVYYSRLADPPALEELRAGGALGGGGGGAGGGGAGGGYDDYTDHQLAMVWPWDMEYRDPEAGAALPGGTFALPLQFKTLDPGHYYVKVFVKENPGTIPYQEYQGGLQLPGEDTVCAGALVLTVPLPSSPGGTLLTHDGAPVRARPGTAPLSAAGDDATAMTLDTLQSLVGEAGTPEEKQARAQALALALAPDPPPLARADLRVVSGAPVPPAGWEQRLFLPADRLTHMTMLNLALSVRRHHRRGSSAAPAPPRLEGEEAEEEEGGEGDDGSVLYDLQVVGEEARAGLEAEGYALAPLDLGQQQQQQQEGGGGGGGGGEELPPLYLAARRGPGPAPGVALEGEAAPLVDAALVYGESAFAMGGGFVTRALPPALGRALGADLFLATKRLGAGRAAAEALARDRAAAAERAARRERTEAKAQARAARGGGSGAATEDEDEDDGEDELSEAEAAAQADQAALVDKGMTPEEIAEWEARREEDLGQREAARQRRELRRRRREATEALRARLEEAKGEKARALKAYGELQRQVAALFQRRRRTFRAQEQKDKGEGVASAAAGGGGAAAAAAPAHESEKAYADALAAIMEARDRLARQQGGYDQTALDLQARLDDKEGKAHEITAQFRAFKREIAEGAENSRTGKPLPGKIIEQFEETEQAKDEETEKVRLKNINLRMALKKLEARLRAKEQLAEGLHLIDFEQLRIENQSQTEKIEERNEELHKLRRKNQKTVEVLTHMKEKLKFVEAENAGRREALRELDAQLAGERDRLGRAKHQRDALRAEAAALRDRQGFTNSDLLVVDFEQRKLDIKQLQDKIAELKERHGLLGAQAHREKARLRGSNARSATTRDDMMGAATM